MAKSNVWKGTSTGGSWGNTANWTLGLPVTAQTDVFNSTAGGTVTLGTAVGGSVIVHGGAGNTLTFAGGTLTLTPAPVKKGLPIDLQVDSAAVLTLAADASVSGTQEILITGTGSTLNVLGRLYDEITIVSGGTVNIGKGGTFTAGSSGIFLSNNAVLNVTAGGTLSHLDTTPGVQAAYLELGSGIGPATANITGKGALVNMDLVEVGNGYSGTLSITKGGVVHDQVGIGAEFGDSKITVDGKGSAWLNDSGLVFGGAVPVAGTLTVTNNATLGLGGNMTLAATFQLDGSARITGDSILDGGAIIALAGKGDVVLRQPITITTNWMYNFRPVAFFAAEGNTTLKLLGQITNAASNGTLSLGIGHIFLGNAGNSQTATDIYNAVVEARTAGALGSGRIAFIDNSKAATLIVDGPAKLDNVLSHFGALDAVDLAGFAFSAATSLSWTSASGGSGGSLRLDNGVHVTTLNFDSKFLASSFVLSNDGHGGTLIQLSTHT